VYFHPRTAFSQGIAMQLIDDVINSEVAILRRVLEPSRPTLSAAAARAFLALDFTSADRDRMKQPAAKAREGTLSSAEQTEINNYERVGHFLSMLQSKARRSLKALVESSAAAIGPGRSPLSPRHGMGSDWVIGHELSRGLLPTRSGRIERR
jgi:hypothetical protein